MPRKTPLSRYRVLARNVLRMAERHYMPVFLAGEVGIGGALELRRRHGYSMVSILVKEVADAVAAKPEYAVLASAFERGLLRDKVIYQDTVNISVSLGKYMGDEEVVSRCLVKAADVKSLDEIDEEVRRGKALAFEDDPTTKRYGKFLMLPSWVQRGLLGLGMFNTQQLVDNIGSVGVTNMGDSAVQLAYPVANRNLMVAAGRVSERLALVDGEVVEQPVIHMVLSYNHYVMDGMVVGRFFSDLKGRLEGLG